MKRNYKISVAMATYNGEKYIKEQIESILSQLDCYDEVIVSDDGSTDQTIAIIEKFHDPRIKVIQGPKKGVKQNFSHAIFHCHGKYIFLADQDDIWEMNKVNRVLQEFNKSQAVVVVHDCIIVDHEMNIVNESFYSLRASRTGFSKNILKNSYIGCCMAFHCKLKNKILPIPDKIEMHDQWIGLIGETYGKCVFISDRLIRYRRHGSNVSQLNRHYSLMRMLKNRIVFFRTYMKRTKRIVHYIKAMFYRFRIMVHEIFVYYRIQELNQKYLLEQIGERINYVSGGKVFQTEIERKKVLLKGFDIFQLYQNEARILKKLDSSFFPKILFTDQDFFVEEYVKGSTLSDYLSDHVLTESLAKELIQQFILCLDELYRKKIIHRDIRPDNILIDEVDNQFRIKIIDFGCAIDLEYSQLIFSSRIENYLGEEYRESNLYWDDAVSFFNLLSSLSIDVQKYQKEISEIEKRIGRIKYERRI